MISRLLLLCLLTLPVACASQQIDTPTRQAGELTAEQSVDFAQAKQDFASSKWAEAFSTLQTLHAKHPRNVEVAKYAAEAAMNTGDYGYAETALKPIVTADAEDWQAMVLMARCYAQQNRDIERDAALAKLLQMHANTTNPRFRQMTQFLVERIATATGHVDLYYSLQPWSRYNIYEMGRFFDATGKQTSRITLESNDFDQPLWAKSHEKEAAAGMRMFSMDSYSESVTNANGQTTQTHGTMGFFDGRPSYNEVRDRMLGKGKPQIQSTTTGPVQKP